MELINQIDETICFNENNIRVIGTFQEPWFVAKDVCNILELKDVSNALLNISEKWKGTKVISTLGGKQDMRIINEAGLYKLIMRSNKPVAQKFQEVVCEEILPNLRKKGEYKIQSIIDKNKELEDKLKEETYIRKNLKARYEHFLEKRIDNEKYHKGNLIYLIGFEELPHKYKIGYTRNLNKRLEKGRTDVPFDAIVLYKRYFSLPDPIKIEKNIHYALRKFRMKNCKEWFKTDDVYNSQTFIDQIDEVVSFFEMIDKRYENKKDIKYEQLKKYIEQEKLETDEKELDEDEIDEELDDDEIDEDEIEDETDEELGDDEIDEDEIEDETDEEELEEDLKRCYKCETYMNKSNFAKSSKRKDGLNGCCKSCKNESYRKRKIDRKINLKEKKCTQCNTIKDISEFYNRIGSVDGKTSECKDCTMVMYEKRKEKYETADVVIPENKKCHICEIVKEITEFDLKKDSPDGHKIWCKKCCSEYAKNKRLEPKVAPPFKNCNECLKELSIDNFWNNKSTKDGKDNKCITCHKKKRKASS